MIKEAYCSFEVSKLLKEKGFDEPCRSAYIWNSEEYELCALFSKSLHFNREGGLEDYEDDSVPRISAPTHQMAIAWLREVHNIFIEISVDEMLKDEGYQWALYYNSTKEIRPYSGWGNSYEETVEAALKYVLENLI